MIALQLLAVGYAQSLADGAAEAGAIAVADGRDPEEAARAGLPGWAESRTDVESEGGKVEIELEPPALLPWAIRPPRGLLRRLRAPVGGRVVSGSRLIACTTAA